MSLFKKNQQQEEGLSLIITDAVEAEQVAIAFRQMRLSSIVVLINSLILCWALWGTVNNSMLIGWTMTQFIAMGWRWLKCREYRLYNKSHTSGEWKNIFLIGMSFSALIWGITPFILFPTSIIHQTFLVIIIAGMSAGAVSSLASIRYAAQIYLTLIILPIIGVVLMQDDSLYIALAFMMLLYWVLLLLLANRIYKNITSALHSRILHEQALSELELSEERFETIFQEAPTGIFYYDNDLIVIETNIEMIKILQISREQMIGLDMKKLPDSSLDEALSAPKIGKKGYYKGPYKSMINKLDLWITLQTSPIYDANRNIIGGVGIGTDITNQILAEEKMKHQAYYDTLTDIPNRALLKDRIVQALAHYRRHNSLIAVLFLDLDHFKNINDSLGHHVGDALLIETAKRLVSVCREGDTVARLGGDEFVILLEELGTDAHSAAARAELVAEKVHEVLTAPFDVGLSEAVLTSSSIGISLVNSDEQTVDDLLKFADTAMYQAKKEGRNTTRFYQEQMDRWIKKRIFLENGLRHAIENGELELYYQPVIETESQQIVGAEALLRWNHPDLGMIMPDDMISIAEESGLIVPIGEWVLREACTQFVRWRAQQTSKVHLQRIAVNVSAVQFRQSDFVDRVIRIVAETGIVPYMLELELTESTVIDRIDTVIAKMSRLRGAGISISMDDFGTGYSSLAYLKRLPFTTLKIDKSFVRDIMSDKDDAALVETILSIASIFNLEVIAEGVEELDQYLFLRDHHCHYFQGYLCSKPIPILSFEELLTHNVLRCHTL